MIVRNLLTSCGLGSGPTETRKPLPGHDGSKDRRRLVSVTRWECVSWPVT